MTIIYILTAKWRSWLVIELVTAKSLVQYLAVLLAMG
jgi:hypothetical protein